MGEKAAVKKELDRKVNAWLAAISPPGWEAAVEKPKTPKKTVRFDMDANVTRIYEPHGLECDEFPQVPDKERASSLLKYKKAALETYKRPVKPKGTSWVGRVGRIEYEALAREEKLEVEAAAKAAWVERAERAVKAGKAAKIEKGAKEEKAAKVEKVEKAEKAGH